MTKYSVSWFLLLLLTMLLPAVAQASMADLVGVTPRGMALVRADVAWSDTVDSCYSNPANMVYSSPGLKALFGYNYLISNLQINHETQEISVNHGILAGIAGLVPFDSFLKNRIGAGLLMYMPAQSLLWLHLHMRDDPHFPLYENRFQRLIVRPSLAVRVWEGMSLGATLNYYVDLSGAIQAQQGADRAIAATANLELLSSLAADFALSYQILHALRVSAVYRQSQYTDTWFLTKNRLGSIDLDLDISGVALYEPEVLEFGAAWKFDNPNLLLLAGFAWRFWSKYPGSASRLIASVPTGTSENKQFDPVNVNLGISDTYELKLAAEYTLAASSKIEFVFRSGFAFEPAAIEEQTGETNMLDSDKYKIGFGLAGTWIPDTIVQRISFQIGAQVQVLPERTHKKDPNKLIDMDPSADGLQTNNPGWPSISGGGTFWAISAGISFDFAGR